MLTLARIATRLLSILSPIAWIDLLLGPIKTTPMSAYKQRTLSFIPLSTTSSKHPAFTTMTVEDGTVPNKYQKKDYRLQSIRQM